MSESKLLIKFIDPKNGPVVSITTVPYPSFWRRCLWHSTAKLNPVFNLQDRAAKIFDTCSGGGWSSNKEQSQCKAITEAIERWSYNYYSEVDPHKAGLDIDNTSNGFAALPYTLGMEKLVLNAYCEAIERWALTRMWDCADFHCKKLTITNTPWTKLFKGFDGHLHCFTTEFITHPLKTLKPKTVTFCFCLFETRTGGAIPGSACGEELSSTVERAMSEAFLHTTAFTRLNTQAIAEPSHILEQRLYHFGKSTNGYSEVYSRLKIGDHTTCNDAPKISFSEHLIGPWNPEVLVHRVLVEHSLPLSQGGKNRFLI